MDSELLKHSVAKLVQAQSSPVAGCKVCGGDSVPFDVVDFNKSCEGFICGGAAGAPVIYRRCTDCQFIFTEFFDEFTADMWREHVYNSDYEKIDPQYKNVRCRINAHLIRTFLIGRKRSIIGLDYGGGNGKTSLLMRDRGWIYDSYDPYDRTIVDEAHSGRYNFASAIEVFEHTPDPLSTVRDIVRMMSPDSIMILISTVLTDGAVSDRTGLGWWYAAPRNGHVSLYSRKSLEKLASRVGLQCLCMGSGPHFMYRGYKAEELRRLVIRGKLIRRLQFLNRRFYRRLTSKEIE